MDDHGVQALKLYSRVIGICGIWVYLTLEWEVTGEQSS